MAGKKVWQVKLTPESSWQRGRVLCRNGAGDLTFVDVLWAGAGLGNPVAVFRSKKAAARAALDLGKLPTSECQAGGYVVEAL